MSLKETERNERIIRYRLTHKRATMTAMGKVFHISRQRIAQILDKAKKRGLLPNSTN